MTKEGSNEFLFKVAGQKHTFQASSAAERDSWVAAIEAKSTEAKAEKETIVSGEGYKAELEKLTKPAAIVAATKKTEAEEETPKETTEEAKPEEPKEEKKEEKAAAKSRSQSRKRSSIFGTLLGKKDTEEKKPEETKEETAEEAKAAEPVAEIPAEVAAAAPATEETIEGMLCPTINIKAIFV